MLIPDRSPFRGFTPFGEQGQISFFGREEEIDRCCHLLRSNYFAVVAGQRAIGKSSLIQAGVMARLTLEQPSPFGAVNYLRFGPKPLIELEQALSRAEAQNGQAESTPLLVIDDFDDLDRYVDQSDRENILRTLSHLAGTRRFAILIGIYIGSLSLLAETPGLAKATENSLVLLAPLQRDQLYQAITFPAAMHGVSFEPDLVSAIINDVGAGISSLSSLQITLNTLFENRQSDMLTMEDYRRTKPFNGSIERRLDDIWNAADLTQKTRIKSVLLRLCGPAGTHLIVPLTEFSDSDSAVIRTLAGGFALTTSIDSLSGSVTVQIAHDSILTHWSRLRDWIDENQADLTFRQSLQDRAKAWAIKGRSNDLLLKGELLKQADEWVVKQKGDINLELGIYLRESKSTASRRLNLQTIFNGLGLHRIEKSFVEAVERRNRIEAEVGSVERMVAELQDRKSKLLNGLTENKRELDTLTPKVFISYAKVDFGKIMPLYEQFKANGIDPWLDSFNLLPGDIWGNVITKEIRRSDFVLICLSSGTVGTPGYRHKEVRIALSASAELPLGQSGIIPVRLDECMIPDELALYQVSHLFLEGEFERLLRGIFSKWGELKGSQASVI